MSEQQQEQQPSTESGQIEQTTQDGQSSTQSSAQSETTVFVTTTQHHTIVITRPSSSVLTPSVTATADSHAQTTPCTPGTPCAIEGPAKATIVFWALIMAVLMITFVGYIVLFFWLWRTRYVDGQRKAREAAQKAKLAAKEAVSAGAPIDQLAPKIIDTGRRRTRRASIWHGKGKLPDVQESYEMDTLPHHRHPHQEQHDDDASLHVHWGTNTAGPSTLTEPRSRSRSPANSDRTNREARIWTGLSARNIRDVDESTRISALQQMREMQLPVQRNFGDDDLWSPVRGTTTEELRERFRARRGVR